MPGLVDVTVVTKQKWRAICTWPECRVSPETELATTSHGSQTLVLPKYSSSSLLTLYCMVLPCGNMSKNVNFRKLIHAIEGYTKYEHIY